MFKSELKHPLVCMHHQGSRQLCTLDMTNYGSQFVCRPRLIEGQGVYMQSSCSASVVLAGYACSCGASETATGRPHRRVEDAETCKTWKVCMTSAFIAHPSCVLTSGMFFSILSTPFSIHLFWQEAVMHVCVVIYESAVHACMCWHMY